MQHALLLLPVVLPVLFWGAYHYYKDRHLPEPAGNLALCFLLGLVAAAVSKGMYMALEPLGWRYDAFALAETDTAALFRYAVLAIGPIEEFSKLMPFVLVVVHLKAFDEPLDGIIYASFIALGYAAVENYFYLDFLTRMESIARGFAGPVVHILFASIWAHWITSEWLAERRLLGPALGTGAEPARRSAVHRKPGLAREPGNHCRRAPPPCAPSHTRPAGSPPTSTPSPTSSSTTSPSNPPTRPAGRPTGRTPAIRTRCIPPTTRWTRGS